MPSNPRIQSIYELEQIDKMFDVIIERLDRVTLSAENQDREYDYKRLLGEIRGKQRRVQREIAREYIAKAKE